VVSGARGDDTPCTLLAQRSDLRECTAELERSRPLQVLGLEHDRGADPFAQRARCEHGRLADDAGAGLGGMANFVE
jgi:hypothetical protein